MVAWRSGQTYSDGEYVWEVDRLLTLVSEQEPVMVQVAMFPPFDVRIWANRLSQVTARFIVEHGERIMLADLFYPILLTPEGEIVDGYHRLAKARLLGVREIAALRLPDNYREYAAGKV